MERENSFRVDGLPAFNVRVASFGWHWPASPEDGEFEALAVWELEVRSRDGLTADLRVELDLEEDGVGEEIAAQMALFGVHPEEFEGGLLGAADAVAGREAVLCAPTGDGVERAFRALAAFRAPTEERVQSYEAKASLVFEAAGDGYDGYDAT